MLFNYWLDGFLGKKAKLSLYRLNSEDYFNAGLDSACWVLAAGGLYDWMVQHLVWIVFTLATNFSRVHLQFPPHHPSAGHGAVVSFAPVVCIQIDTNAPQPGARLGHTKLRLLVFFSAPDVSTTLPPTTFSHETTAMQTTLFTTGVGTGTPTNVFTVRMIKRLNSCKYKRHLNEYRVMV